jgi:hypothetical protein
MQEQDLHHPVTEEIEASPVLLRRIKGICSRLPASQDPKLQAALLQEKTDATLINLLATLTQGCAAIDKVRLRYTSYSLLFFDVCRVLDE